MRILVTGGAGYVGSILVQALLGEGHQVVVIDNFRWRQDSLNHLCSNPHFDVVRGDARNMEVVRPALKVADVVIPLAALVGAPLCDADVDGAWSTNYEAIDSLLRFASPEQRFILPNTNSGYGVGEPGRACDEETTLRPISVYGQTKCQAEKAVLDRGNSITFRLATVFGMSPRMRLDLLVNDFVHRAVTDRAVVLFEPHFKRNYIHVRDVARAFVHAIDNFDAMKDRPYNVGLSDANLSKLELCQRIARWVPGFAFLEAPIGKDPDKRDYVVSNTRIEAAGFKTVFPLDEGILELVKGFRMIRNGRYGNA